MGLCCCKCKGDDNSFLAENSSSATVSTIVINEQPQRRDHDEIIDAASNSESINTIKNETNANLVFRTNTTFIKEVKKPLQITESKYSPKVLEYHQKKHVAQQTETNADLAFRTNTTFIKEVKKPFQITESKYSPKVLEYHQKKHVAQQTETKADLVLPASKKLFIPPKHKTKRGDNESLSDNIKTAEENICVENNTALKQKIVVNKKHLLFRRKNFFRNADLLLSLLECIITPTSTPYLAFDNVYIENILDEESKQYNFVKSYFRNRKFNDTYELKSIVQVWNPYIYLQYQLMKLKHNDLLETQMLYHGTKMEHLENILTNNFDWRKVKSGKFSWGISFANNPWYSSHYCKRQYADGKDLVMILTRVLIGKTGIGNYRTIVPSKVDTTTNHDGQVLVKYDDACFYPEYIIYFKERQ